MVTFAYKNIYLIPVSRLNLKDLYSLLSNKNITGVFQPAFNLTFAQLLNKLKKNKINYFLVKDKKGGDLLGYAYWVLEQRFNSYEIGAAIIPSKRNQGYGLKIHRALIKLLLSRYKSKRIQAIVAMKNQAEIKILKKCNFVNEGILKKAGKIGRKYLDLGIWSMLR